jgi:Ca2+/Na+ antiporter
LENFIRICPSNRLDILIKDSSRLIVYINYILLKIDYWGGWACFVVSIFIIGVLTAVIGDLASHFGCTIGLKDSVTAISFVALGTSLPGLIQKFF